MVEQSVCGSPVALGWQLPSHSPLHKKKRPASVMLIRVAICKVSLRKLRLFYGYFAIAHCACMISYSQYVHTRSYTMYVYDLMAIATGRLMHYHLTAERCEAYV